jgi:hypothetical protein
MAALTSVPTSSPKPERVSSMAFTTTLRSAVVCTPRSTSVPCGEETSVARMTWSSFAVGATPPLNEYGLAIVTGCPELTSVQVDVLVPEASASNDRSTRSYGTLGARPSTRISMPLPAGPVV